LESPLRVDAVEKGLDPIVVPPDARWEMSAYRYTAEKHRAINCYMVGMIELLCSG
jgi:hypothetical protein